MRTATRSLRRFASTRRLDPITPAQLRRYHLFLLEERQLALLLTEQLAACIALRGSRHRKGSWLRAYAAGLHATDDGPGLAGTVATVRTANLTAKPLDRGESRGRRRTESLGKPSNLPADIHRLSLADSS
jgi:hypothetical protein